MQKNCYYRNYGLSFCTAKCEYYWECRNYHEKMKGKRNSFIKVVEVRSKKK